MQVDPIKRTLKAPGTKRLKLKYDQVVSNFAFKINLRRYKKVAAAKLLMRRAGNVPRLRGRVVQVDPMKLTLKAPGS